MGIRKMCMDDYDELYALWTRTPGMGLNSVDDTREGIARYLTRNPETCFVFEEDGHVLGAILAGHDGRRGIISHTAVDVTARRRGIGRVLVGETLEALKRERISKVFLVAFARNTTGNAFWEAMGFSERTDLTYRNLSLTEMTRIDT